jgi:hypothetical protein
MNAKLYRIVNNITIVAIKALYSAEQLKTASKVAFKPICEEVYDELLFNMQNDCSVNMLCIRVIGIIACSCPSLSISFGAYEKAKIATKSRLLLLMKHHNGSV